MVQIPEDLKSVLQDSGQTHLVEWWTQLTEEECAQFEAQLRRLDLTGIHAVWQASRSSDQSEVTEESSRGDTAGPPLAVVSDDINDDEGDAAVALGEKLLSAGKVAVVTVAGGQGTRLGFNKPKGMFPIGPVSGMSLFRIFAEQIQARRNRHSAAIPWLIMTSAATHADTVAYFEEQSFFGLSAESVHFFQQGSLPAVDADTGRVLLADRTTPCLSPDGHGGMVTALESSGLLQQLESAGVEHLFYHQVDNPTVLMCDPFFLGAHVRAESQLTTKVVRKVSPDERMGVLAEVQGRTEIIEYSELTPEQARRTDDNGADIFWAGNTAIHAFDLRFLRQLTTGGCALELHVAHKKVPHINPSGAVVAPTEPNANKFERFIFDALPLAERTLIVEGNRAREFNPVKNAEGSDSPATARAAISRIGWEWLQAAGHELEAEQLVEVSPLTALDADELAERLSSGRISLAELT